VVIYSEICKTSHKRVHDNETIRYRILKVISPVQAPSCDVYCLPNGWSTYPSYSPLTLVVTIGEENNFLMTTESNEG